MATSNKDAWAHIDEAYGIINDLADEYPSDEFRVDEDVYIKSVELHMAAVALRMAVITDKMRDLDAKIAARKSGAR